MSGSSRSTSISTSGSSMLISTSGISISISGSSRSMSTSTARDSSCCADRTGYLSEVSRVACAGHNSKAIPDASTERKYVLLMLSSSIQPADCPVSSLLHRRIQIWQLPQLLQPRSRLRIAPFHQLIDQRNLHQRRLLLLQSVDNGLLDLRLTDMPAQRIQRRQPHIHALVVPQCVPQ